MTKQKNNEAGGPAKKNGRASQTTSTKTSPKKTAPKGGEKYMVRFVKPGQRVALMREAEKNFRSMNDEVLFRVFGEPVVFIRVTEADIAAASQADDAAKGNGSFMVRFTKPGQRAALMRECERSNRSVSNEILFRVFGEVVSPISISDADIKESNDG